MITGDDIRRLEEEATRVSKKLLIIETQQFFEIEVPTNINPHKYVETDECKKICADKILSGITDLYVERVYTEYNEVTGEWT